MCFGLRSRVRGALYQNYNLFPKKSKSSVVPPPKERRFFRCPVKPGRKQGKIVKNASSADCMHINILMHDTDAKDTTVKALPKIIEHYRKLGYAFKGLTIDSYAPHHHVNN